MGATTRGLVVGSVLSFTWIGANFADEQPIGRTQLAKIGKASTALVQVGGGRGQLGQGPGYGSAFCVHGSGLFVTNEHVVHPQDPFRGVQDGPERPITLIVNPGQKGEKSYAARLVRADKQLDLALLRVDGLDNFPALRLGDDEKLEELMDVVAFGFPYGTGIGGARGSPEGQPPTPDGREYPSVSVNSGAVTALRRKDGKLDRIQLDATINPGNSGGPVLDKDGKVVGVIVSLAVAQNLGRTGISSAIPVSHLSRFLARPDVEFDPPALNPGNVYKAVRFEAKVVPLVPSTAPLTAELILKPNRGPEQTHQLEAAGNRYSATVTPLPQPAGPLRLRLLAEFANGLLNATAADQALKVGDRSVQLSEIKSVRLKPGPRVVLHDGKVIEGPLSGLDTVPVQLGDQSLSVNLADAAEIKLAPAVESDEVRYTLVVRQGDREILRQTDSLIVEGLLPVPAAPVSPTAVKRPNLEGNPAVRKLAARLDDVAVGGGGRYLVMHLPARDKLAVFDVSAADFVGEIPAKDAGVRFAAGMDYVVLLLPGSGKMERWSLKTLKREDATSLPVSGPVKSAAMGSASRGPLLVHWGPVREGNIFTGFALVDVENMKLLQSEIPLTPQMQMLLPSHDVIHVRASANGKLFGMWSTSHGPSGVGVVEVTDGGTQSYYAHWGVGHVVPGPDGKFLFTRSGKCEPRPGINDMQGPRGDPVLPACGGNFYLDLPPGQTPGRPFPPQPRTPESDQPAVKAGTVTVRSLTNDRAIATFPDLPLPGFVEEGIKHDLTFDKRVHLIPEARLIITIPESNDRLLLYPFNARPAADGRADAVAGSNDIQSAFWPYTTNRGEGCFLKQGKEWLEVSEGVMRYKFKETARTPEYVELYDDGRRMWVRLFSNKAVWRQSGDKWFELPVKPSTAPAGVRPGGK